MTEREKIVNFIKNAKAAYQSMDDASMSEEEYIADCLIGYDTMSAPFAVGDTIYVDGDNWGTAERFKTVNIKAKDFVIAEITSVIKTGRTLFLRLKGYCKDNNNVVYKKYNSSSIGKTVFLTRDQIEKALAERSKE